MKYLYNPSERLIPNKKHSEEDANRAQDASLHVPMLINVLEASNTKEMSPHLSNRSRDVKLRHTPIDESPTTEQ